MTPNTIHIMSNDDETIIELSMIEYIELEIGIAKQLLDEHCIYQTRGRLNRAIEQYEKHFCGDD